MRKYSSSNKRGSKHEQNPKDYFGLGRIGKFLIRAKLKELEPKLDSQIIRKHQIERN
jgi:hypothetical protein